MCGITGCLGLAAGERPDPELVRVAAERMSHRGPDDDGFFTDAEIALAVKRLAIIERSAAGHQPMRSGDGRYCMVFNGEIYNYAELGDELRREGVRLRARSDSEVLLEAYTRYGKDVVHRLRGMFAFAIWDCVSRELFCARDQFGIKPFCYVIDGLPGHPPLLRFASERKALADAGELRALDRGAVRRYLSFEYVPAPETMASPFRVLPPGHAMIARPDGTVRVYRYWRAALRPEPAPRKSTGADILAALRDAITRHDGPPAPGGWATATSITEAIFAQADRAGLDDVSASNSWILTPGWSATSWSKPTA